MAELDLETRIELALTYYAGMLKHLAELERKMNDFERELNKWQNS